MMIQDKDVWEKYGGLKLFANINRIIVDNIGNFVTMKVFDFHSMDGHAAHQAAD